MSVAIKTTSGPAIERPGDLAAILTNLRAGDVLFIDEVHRLARPVEEVLYPAMEDFKLDIIIGKGPSARSIRLKIPRFTLIGATTRYAMMSAPLRDRFGAIYRLDYYDQAAMETIVHRSASILNVAIDPNGVTEIASRARGTPRVANRLLRRVRDFAQVRADGAITANVARDALELLEVDALGLDEIDRKVLRAIIEKFDGGPVGLDNHCRINRRRSRYDYGCVRAVPPATWLFGSQAAVGASRRGARTSIWESNIRTRDRSGCCEK